MITAVRRKSDGYLADVQETSSTIKPSEAIVQARVTNAQASAGGEVDDWELVEIDPTIWQHYNPRCKHYLTSVKGQIQLYQSDPEPEPEAEAEPVDVMAEIRDLRAEIATLKAQVGAKAE